MIGKLNKRVTLQAPAMASDGMGGFNVTWFDQASVWAAIWPTSASEQIQTEKPTMTISHRIRIRYRSVLNPEWRIKFGNRYFNIDSIINPNEQNEWLDILCRETK